MNSGPSRGGGAAGLHHRTRVSTAVRGFALDSDCRGMVTAEFAVGLLAVVPMVLSLVALIGAGATQIQVVEAARTGARLLARGESDAAATQQVSAIVPRADLHIARGAGAVVFEVRQRVGGNGLLPGFTLRAEASSPAEIP